MKKTLVITLITALMVTMVSVAAFGYGKGQGPGQGPRQTANDRGGPGLVDLKLTEDQQRKILEIRQQFQKDTLDLRFEMQKKRLELAKLWQAKPINQNAIDAKTKEVTALRVQMVTKMQSMQEKIKALLTAEQLKIYNERISDCNPGFGGQGKRDGQGRGCGMGMMGAGFRG